VNYNLATGEGLIRNNCGVWVAGFSVNFDRASVEPAEMKALLEGLSLAWSLSIKRLIVQCNNNIVVSAVMSSSFQLV